MNNANMQEQLTRLDTKKKRRSGWRIMTQLIVLIKPLIHIMLAAILLGTAGYLCAIFLTILAGQALIKGLYEFGNLTENAVHAGGMLLMPVTAIFILMFVIAVLRGVLHYAEQYCNHFIAFKLLAIIRHKVFAALRKLCPAKLEGRDKGNLISIITTDIELLEVFYAHTISPIAIAILTSLLMFHWKVSHICRDFCSVCVSVCGDGDPYMEWETRRRQRVGISKCVWGTE